MRKQILLLAALGLGAISLPAQAMLKVVATLPDLAAIAREIGGDKVKITSLAQGAEDPHFVDAKPSFIRRLNEADVLIEGGAELEIGWLAPLVNNARNPRILASAPGHVIASGGVRLLDIPSGPVDRSQGDVHPMGNPHFLLDPANGKIVAERIAKTFGRLDASNAGVYEKNLRRFNERLDQSLAEWTGMLKGFRGVKVVSYHKSFDYFLERFGSVLAGTIEPKPGIEPSPTHINALIPRMKADGVKLVLMEPNRPRKTPEYVAKTAGAKLVVLLLMPGGHAQASDYFSWLAFNVEQVATALRSTP